ncbi:hypothetical protein AURANDRAFT_68974 [Aureococcus anophagefferens]|uniref:Uncharacterized protein n=1 Tax=Aureococcus anophagefferens TaxID=44056 RepID=F0YRC1_AURAN|nr:hypothetical protein AURANDRAFT_68974 [Aureococcus anophagefferens]EGB02338.1 hypothetical protein AURANDRAFT_68974 [Aureococcus anophagefferens]|eukprot:XP_009042962.1 hypothetical protein AURANDRAFT_68974 [Aureococcus anophagefferens]
MSEQHALCIDATRVAPAHLKSRGNQVDRMMDQLGKAVINWTEVLALVEPTAAITPTTTHFENKTIGWIEEYEQKIKDLDESFRGSNVFSMEVGHDDALKMLDTNEKVFVEETKIFEKNAHLCVVFEFPEKINTSQEILQNALSIGGVGNLSACAEWEHPCSTRRRSECLAWDAEEYEVDEQNDLFMSEFLDVADGVTGTRKTDVANASSGYAYSLVGVSQPPTIYVDESNCSARPFSDDNDEHVVADVFLGPNGTALSIYTLSSSAFSVAFDEALGDQPAMLADGTYLAGGVVATVVDDVVQGSAATGIVLESLHAGMPRGVRVSAGNSQG